MEKEKRMKLAKVSKRINVLKGDISDLQNRVKHSMRTIEGNEYDEDFKVLSDELDKSVESLIALKAARMRMNVEHSVYEKILRLGELKSMVAFVEGLDVRSGIDRGNAWDNEKAVVYKSQMTTPEKHTALKNMKAELVQLSDDLDEFNASNSLALKLK